MTTTQKTMAETAIENEGGPDALAKWLIEQSNRVEGDWIEYGCDEPSNDVRLRVHEGNVYVYAGLSDCDTDHRGFWGSSSVRQNLTEDDALSIAEDLIDQVLDHEAQSA